MRYSFTACIWGVRALPDFFLVYRSMKFLSFSDLNIPGHLAKTANRMRVVNIRMIRFLRTS